MPVVAVTGAAASIGRLVLEALARTPDVGRVVAIDTTAPVATQNAEFYRMDVRDASLASVLDGCEAAVHLARASWAADPDEARDLNVRGARALAVAAVKADVKRVVLMSSALVYGAHPDNDFPLTEVSPVRPTRELPASGHAAEAEDAVTSTLAGTGAALTVLRTAPVVGPNVGGQVARILEAPVMLGIEGYAAPVQVAHSDDVVAAVVAAATRDIPGVYNVCSDGWLQPTRAAELLGKRRVVLSYEAALRLTTIGWRAGLSALDPAALAFIQHPWVMSNLSLREQGLAPAHSNESALRAAARSHRGWVSLGRVRFRPRVAAGVVAAAAALAGSAVARGGRRKHGA